MPVTSTGDAGAAAGAPGAGAAGAVAAADGAAGEAGCAVEEAGVGAAAAADDEWPNMADMMFPKMLIPVPPGLKRIDKVLLQRTSIAAPVGVGKANNPVKALSRGRAPQRLHDRRAAAVDVDRAAGHIGGRVGGEERRDIGEFFGAAHTA